MAYTSQCEAADDRAARRADRIQKRLGWPIGILNGPGLKPKDMHQRTFDRLLTRHDAFVAESLAGLAKKLGLLQSRLGDIDIDPFDFR